jgi:MFS transporter, ceroid-lipofuscinosis neuronal protein 7
MSKAVVDSGEDARGDATLLDDNNGATPPPQPPPQMKDYVRPLVPQMMIGFIDAVSFMVVAPSLVFYVLQLGGTKESYGIILASFSFSSFTFKPLLAYWSDSVRQFKPPYMASTVAAGFGGLLYFFASTFPAGRTAVAMVLVGRLLGGCGAANTTLGYTYVAHVIPSELFTPANALLSMVRVVGMALAPALNAAVAWIHADVTVGGYTVHIHPLNAVGLLLAAGNALGFLTLYFLFREPTDMAKPSSELNSAYERPAGLAFWMQMVRFDILVPLFSIIVLNANYQLLETGLAPSANDILGWEPVRISALFGVNALVIFGVILLTYTLASRGVADVVLMQVGLLLSIVGYLSMYLLWRRGAAMIAFVLPVLVSCSVFPFLSSPTRSLFTKAVMVHPHLKHHQGTMQALLSMAVSVAGFAAPGLIAAYVLRSPDEVSASADQREFTPWALFAPVLSFLILAGVAYVESSQRGQGAAALEGNIAMTEGANGTAMEDESSEFTSEELTERLALLESSTTEPPSSRRLFHMDSKTIEASRRHTVMMMGIPDISIHGRRGFPLFASDAAASMSSQRYRSTVVGLGGGAGAASRGGGQSSSTRHTLAW